MAAEITIVRALPKIGQTILAEGGREYIVLFVGSSTIIARDYSSGDRIFCINDTSWRVRAEDRRPS